MNKKGYYPLTHGQKGLWYTEQFYPGTSIGNIAASIRIWGEIDYDKLGQAINLFIEKNEGMRLRIVEADGEPRQYVADHKDHEWDMLDFSDKGGMEAFCFRVDRELEIPFDLIDSDLFYYCLYKAGPQEGGIFVRTHHLISDAWTMTLMATEIIDFYTKLYEGEPIPEEFFPSYLDFVQSEEWREQSHEFAASRAYWQEVFSTMPVLTTLKPRQTHSPSSKAARSKFILPQSLTEHISRYCDENRASGFYLFLAAFSTYLYRVTGKDDIVIGVPILLRPGFKEQTTTGMFIDTVPLRLALEEDLTFADYLIRVAETWRQVRNYRYPYNTLLHDVRQTHRTTDVLYDTMLSFQKASFDIARDYETQWYFNRNQTDSLCISISDRENTGFYIVEMDWLADLFNPEEIKGIYHHLITVLEDGLKNPMKRLCELDILAEDERQQLIYDFNNTATDYPQDKTIHQLFEAQVERTPDAVALIFGDLQITYTELNSLANQVAGHLINQGVQPDEMVGIMVSRSPEMVAGMLGILKSGAAYLPLDPEYPSARICFMLEDSGAKILLTQNNLADLQDFGGTKVFLDDEGLYAGQKGNPLTKGQTNNLAYVIYTSGSTGKPKGVMIEHRNVVNFMAGVGKRINFMPGRTILSATTISFDIHVLETWLALTRGLCVVIADEDQQMDPSLLANLILTNGIDMVQMTPSRMQLLMAVERGIPALESVREIMIGGEAFPEALLQRLQATTARIYNMYGPTETTVWSTIQELTERSRVDIGTPIQNTQVYIIDFQMNLMPLGAAGELCIGGDGVARGYLNRPELTEERFVENPFRPGELIYRTGDLARWLPDGHIEHLGRIDHQVKIRGYRVELGEIENRLLEYAGVREAAIADRSDESGIKYLCAYIVADEKPSIGDLRAFLLRSLPDYMVPSDIVFLDSLPRTPNGKVDRRALPESNVIPQIRAEYVAPRNEMEHILANIWAEVLRVDRVGIDDNFFEMGGHSLKAINLVVAIRQQMGVNIPVRQVFKTPTIGQMAELIAISNEAARPEDLEGLVVLRRGTIPDKYLFLVHPGSGEVAGYLEFCENLGEELTIVGIPALKRDGLGPQEYSIEEMAAAYVEMVNHAQPKGDLLLAGRCFGGTVATEMTLQLERIERTVLFLGLINSSFPSVEEMEQWQPFSPITERTLAQEYMACHVRNIRKCVKMEDIWRHLAEVLTADELREVIPSVLARGIPRVDQLNVVDLIYYLNTYRSFVNARSKYLPATPVAANVVLIEASDDTEVVPNRVVNRQKWQQYCNKPIILYQVPGDHFSMFEQPQVRELSRIFNQALAELAR